MALLYYSRMNMTEITNLDLDHDLVLRAIHDAYEIAKRNRCKYIFGRITCVTGDENIIQKHMGAITGFNKHNVFGTCFFTPGLRGIYIRPGRNKYLTVRTLCHELAHAFTNPQSKHGYSWRSLYLLYYATLPRIFDISEINSKEDLEQEVIITLSNYEPRGATSPDRHLKAMLRMRSWYVEQVESEVAM